MKDTPQTRKRLIAGLWAEAKRIEGTAQEQYDTLHMMALSMFRVNSLKKLTSTQLWQLKNVLRAAVMPDAATGRQIARIRSYADAHNWNASRLIGWIHRQTSKSNIYDLTKKEAQKVITGFQILEKEGKAQ